jgi:hypothetical protein
MKKPNRTIQTSPTLFVALFVALFKSKSATNTKTKKSIPDIEIMKFKQNKISLCRTFQNFFATGFLYTSYTNYEITVTFALFSKNYI